jgi:hypothetical protein
MQAFTKYEVGKPFPGAYPTHEGAVLEIEKAGGGLVLLCQLPGLTPREATAFKDFRRYYYLETATPVPVAYWIFEFAPPLAGLECNLDARLYEPSRVGAWLDTREGVKNLLTIYLLDGPILRAIKAVGLCLEAVAEFRATLRKQLDTSYTSADYTRSLRAIEQYEMSEIKKMAHKYEK